MNPPAKFAAALLLAALCFSLSARYAAAAARTEPGFRVVTWNIQWFPGRIPETDPETERNHIAKTREKLAEIAPDILLLQEIRDWKSASALVSAVPGLQLHVVSDFPERRQNLVIASRFPVESAWVEEWKPVAPETPPRGFAFAAIRLPDDRMLLAYTVHYKSNHGEDHTNFLLRQQASRQLLKHVQKMLALYSKHHSCAVLLGGDFNTSLDDARFGEEKTLRALKSAGFRWLFEGVPYKRRITIPAGGPYPDGCFDHLFSLGLNPLRIEVPQLPDLSDHNPVIADISFRPRPIQNLDLSGIRNLDTVEKPPPLPEYSGAAVPAMETDRLRSFENQEITVRGRVARIGRSPSGHIHFINFSRQPGSFTAIVRDSNHEAVTRGLGGALDPSLVGKEIEVTGILALYRLNPQIEVRNASQIRVVE